jgi:hypothetical protein
MCLVRKFTGMNTNKQTSLYFFPPNKPTLKNKKTVSIPPTEIIDTFRKTNYKNIIFVPNA